VVGAGNKAEPRPIVVGEWAGNDWVVLSGLNAGEKVITEGLVKVFPCAAVLSIFIVLAGIATMRALPIAQYPEIAPPVVTVTAIYPGASAQTLESTVAAPLENAITGVEKMIF